MVQSPRIATGHGYTGLAVADFSHVVDDGKSKPGVGKATPLFRAIYISHTHSRLTDAALDKVMSDLTKRNQRLGLTGLLLYKSRTFFEVIEGPEEVVDITLDRVFRDPRHFKMKVLLRQQAKQRRFDGWNMGFRRLDGTRTQHPGYFALTRRELEARFPRGATREIMHLLRGYLMARFDQPAEPAPQVACRVNHNIAV